jgi:ribosome-binding factor A
MPSAKRYPRTARVNEVMLEVLADELERMSDPRLELVTLTGVDVSRDLAHAKVYYSTMTAAAADDRDAVPDDVAAGLQAAGSYLRGVVGRQMRIRQVPRLEFVLDAGIVSGQRDEEES